MRHSHFKKILLIKRASSLKGGAEKIFNQLKSYSDNIDVIKPRFTRNILAFDLYIQKQFIKKSNKYIFFSLDRVSLTHVFRASEGCHRTWLELKNNKLDAINPKQLLIKYIERNCLKNAKKIICNSIIVKHNFIKFYGEKIKKKIHICYNGVEKNGNAKVKDEKQTRHIINITLIGNDFRRKGVITAINACETLSSRFNIKLNIVGKDKNINKYKKYSQTFKLNIVFHGYLKNTEKILSQTDIFILPTIYDPFSNACLEALSKGIPVITTKYNGFSEIIDHGREGFILDNPTDHIKLSKFIEKCIINICKMSKNAKIKSQKFPMDISIKKMLNIVQSV